LAVTQQAWDWGADAPRLRQADPALWAVDASWQADVDAFWAAPVGQGLQSFLQARLAAGATIYPPEPLRALALTPLNQVKVVILGQDPYHGPGQAEGLAFSVPPGQAVPPSLRNIWQERQRDLALPLPPNGSLLRWAEQGVLLLNSCLTVEDGQANSHAARGWEALTDALIARCSADAVPKVFLLWGAYAQRKAVEVDTQRHAVFMANHPSPLSARRPPTPFLGCGHFGRVNEWLQSRGRGSVDW
jgi:uracil-DNA glycosylase